MEFTFELLAFFFIISTVAGFVDALAGGGGLITMPALIIGGVPPIAALATNKLQGSVGTATASFVVLKQGRVRWSQVRGMAVIAFFASLVGSVAVQFIDVEILKGVIPVVLAVIGVYFLFMPAVHQSNTPPVLTEKTFRRTMVPVIGGYDGMLGPGTGSFFSLAGVALAGKSLVDATATAKVMNFSTNVASMLVFLTAGKIIWTIGVLMMVGQMFGAWVGAHCIFKVNPNSLRVVIVLTCFAMLARYTAEQGWW